MTIVAQSRRSASPIAIAGLPILCLFFGCGGPQGGYDSPQAAFDAYLAAFKVEDFGAAYDALSPESKLYEVGRAVQGCGLSRNYVVELPADAPAAVVRAQENARTHVALLAKYNITLDDLSHADLLYADNRLEMGRRVGDGRGIYIDFWTSFTNYARYLNDDRVPWDRPFSLENLVVDENSAEGGESVG